VLQSASVIPVAAGLIAKPSFGQVRSSQKLVCQAKIQY
jgi:hypothetical protein